MYLDHHIGVDIWNRGQFIAGQGRASNKVPALQVSDIASSTMTLADLSPLENPNISFAPHPEVDWPCIAVEFVKGF